MVSSCSSTPPKPVEQKASKFKAQSFSSDLIYEDSKHSIKLKADIYLLSNDMMRMDVRTQLDFPLVSLLMSDAHLEFVNYRDKKYFSGKPGLRTVDAVVPLEISATDLVAVVLEKPLKNQKCEFQDGNLSQCMGQAGQTPYRVSWTKRDQTGPWYGRAKKMTIQIPQRKINLNFYFTDWQSNLSKVEGLSVLSAPADFQKMNK